MYLLIYLFTYLLKVLGAGFLTVWVIWPKLNCQRILHLILLLIFSDWTSVQGITPILPIFREGILNGSAEVKESAAVGLTELIRRTSSEGLKSSVVNITGPLIRILGDRYSHRVKIAMLDTLTLLLTKVRLSVCLSVCLSLSVCLGRSVTFDSLGLENWVLLCRYTGCHRTKIYTAVQIFVRWHSIYNV